VLAFGLCNLGSEALAAGDFERAKAASLEALELERARPPELRRPNTLGTAQDTLGIVALLEGRLVEARAYFAEPLSLSLETHELASLPWQFTHFAALAARERDFERAAWLLGAADAAGEQGDLKLELGPLSAKLREEAEAHARANLAEAAFVRAHERGRKAAPEEAAAVALGKSTLRQP
jgi:non-specific serine/threonine protein kinase